MRSIVALVAALSVLSSMVSAAPVANILEPLNFAIVGNPTPDAKTPRGDIQPREQASNFRMVGNPAGDSDQADRVRRNNFAIVGNATPDSPHDD